MKQPLAENNTSLPASPASALAGSLLSDAKRILSDFVVADSTALGVAIKGKDIFAVEKRKSWDKSTEARCNFEYKPRLQRRAGVWFFSLWQKSVMGRTLTDIKSDPNEISHFAKEASALITDMLGENLGNGHWCICTTPKRRHKERNFATLVIIEMAKILKIPMYEDVAFCHSRQRINAVFALHVLPAEPNIIVFDDFVTTGSTIKAMDNLLKEHNKNTLLVTGINNLL